MISAVNLQRKFILILMFLGGQFSGGKVVSFQAEKTVISKLRGLIFNHCKL
jgi:hypothetical protein